ncbi:hypothetical protein SK128_016158 [Halocaridina rubra]|uniref:Uncharacterized protein n=1 Tax=Halocaridina rubra TaxID=373956 RepID=A0AAN8WSD2_HALRR
MEVSQLKAPNTRHRGVRRNSGDRADSTIGLRADMPGARVEAMLIQEYDDNRLSKHKIVRYLQDVSEDLEHNTDLFE